MAMLTRLITPLFLLASFASAQSVLIRIQQGNNVGQVANGGSFGVNAVAIGQPQTFRVTITYLGATALSFPQAPVMLGSQDFSISVPPTPNTVLSPNQSLTMELRYAPTSSLLSLAQLDYPTQEAAPTPTAIPGQPAPATPAPIQGRVVLGFSGTVPEFALNYGLAVDSNIMNVPPGGVVPITETVVNSATTATMILFNRGSGTGQVLSVTTTGDAFSLASLPLLPGYLQSGATLQFQVRYRPRQAGTDTGTLTVTFEGGVTYTVNLRGTAIGSYLTYELLPAEGDIRPILPNQVVALPATPVGEKSKVFIRLKNTTTLDIVVSSIVIAGTAFQLSDLPFLPVTMAPGEQQYFSVIFRPTEPGRQNGRLRIGNDSFELAGDGIGAQLTYSYRSPAGVTTVQPLGGVIFPGIQVGGSSTIQFTIENTGSAPAPIVSVGIAADGKSPFTLSGLPALPMAIAPNSSLTFGIRFAPLNTGMLAASLRINTEAFSLSGMGQTPEPLPDYTIQGPATIQPFEQPVASLTLASSYSVELTGTLTITTETDSFVNDPSVQFVTGGRVVNFTIPAGTTRAVFQNGSTSIRFQTGSVAGTIVVTPSFSTRGGLVLTPDNPKRLQSTMAASAPKLISLGVDGRTSTGFVVQAIGYTTTRSLSKITVTFTGKPGYNFPKTEFTQDLTASSFLWFNSSTSAGYGGQFVIQLPVSLSTSDQGTGALPPIQAIESVTVTVANDKGASNTLTALVQ